MPVWYSPHYQYSPSILFTTSLPAYDSDHLNQEGTAIASIHIRYGSRCSSSKSPPQLPTCSFLAVCSVNLAMCMICFHPLQCWYRRSSLVTFYSGIQGHFCSWCGQSLMCALQFIQVNERLPPASCCHQWWGPYFFVVLALASKE